MVNSLLILLAVAAYSIVHSWLASLRVKAGARRQLGPRTERIYRLAFNVFSGVTLLPVLALPTLLPDRHLYTIPMPWRLVTLALQGAAAAAAAVAILQTGALTFIGLGQLIQKHPAVTPRLVVTGLYRYVRHPIYAAGLVFIWLSPIMTMNLLALYLGFSVYLVVGALVEERKLLVEFGETYREYQRKTPMLFPRLF